MKKQIQKVEFEKLRDQVNETIQKGRPWTDTDFPPEFRSICDPKIDHRDPDAFASYEWKRASECYKDPLVFEDGISPDDIE